MDIVCFGEPDLARWEARPERAVQAVGDRTATYEADVAMEAAGPPVEDGPHRRAAAAILAYDIFPHIRAVIRRVPLQVGDTVGALYRGRLFTASRVVDVFDREQDAWWRTGFTYRTLAHHPLLGEETFSVEKELATGRVRVALRSWSRPGTWLGKLGAPILRRVQVGASRAALVHLRARAT